MAMAAQRHGGPCNVRRTSAALLQAFATQAADALASAGASFVVNSSQQSLRQQLLASPLAVAVAPQPQVVLPPPFQALPPPPLPLVAPAEGAGPGGRTGPRSSGCCGRPMLGHGMGACNLQPVPGHLESELHRRWQARERKKNTK
jgi:hypothetical protein